MLQEAAAVLPDREPCPAPFELANNNQFCYLYSVTTAAVPQPDLQQISKSLYPGAHLVAVNTQQEHEAIKAYVTTADPTCTYIWTAGRTNNATGMTDWYWDLGTTTQPVTFFAWRTDIGEPNNDVNPQAPVENAIIMESPYDFNWLDVYIDLPHSAWFRSQNMCYLCEIDL